MILVKDKLPPANTTILFKLKTGLVLKGFRHGRLYYSISGGFSYSNNDIVGWWKANNLRAVS